MLYGHGPSDEHVLQKQEDGAFRSFDLFGSLEQSTPTDAHKPFGSIICGDFRIGDVLIAGSTNLDRLRSELRIKERLTTLPIVTAALELRQDIERRGIPDDFVAGGHLIHGSKTVSRDFANTPHARKKIGGTQSIEHLREQETDAATQLSPANR